MSQEIDPDLRLAVRVAAEGAVDALTRRGAGNPYSPHANPVLAALWRHGHDDALEFAEVHLARTRAEERLATKVNAVDVRTVIQETRD